MDVILWSDDRGRLVAYTPPGGLSTEEAAKSDVVPKDRPHFIVDNGTLPDSRYFAAWRIDAQGGVTIDPETKASIDDPVPQEASSGDFISALHALGWIDAVKAAVAGAGGLAQDLWDHAATFERQNPLVRQIAQGIGKTEADLDALFRLTRTFR